jgi:hypothetical protein
LYLVALLEQSAGGFVAQVMEVQIVHVQRIAGGLESLRYLRFRYWKYPLVCARKRIG